jgi:anti-sigma B factor antagonist
LGDEFSIEEQRDGRQTVLAAWGELDVASCALLRAAVTRAVAGNGIERLVLDLSGLSFCDSSGLGELLVTSRSLEQHGVALAIVSPADAVARKVFTISGLDEVLPFVAAREVQFASHDRNAYRPER